MESRWEKLKTQLKKEKIDAFLITDSTNIFYFFGIWIEGAAFFAGERKFVLTKPMYQEEVEKNFFNWEPIICKNSIEEKLGELSERIGPLKCGFEANFLSFNQYKKIKERFKGELIPCCGLVEKIRSVKEEKEIDCIKKACQVTKSALEYLRGILYSGITEKMVLRKAVSYILKEADDVSFPPIVLFGERTSLPHGKPSLRKLKKGELVLIDIGAKVGNYCADMTRTFVWDGVSERWQRVIEFVKNLQRLAIENIKPGVECAQVEKKIRERSKEAGYEENVLHSLGHGVGLEIHEEPFFSSKSNTPLQEGMVVTVEPGIYFPGEGGVRIEDTILVTSQGGKILP